MQQQKKKGEEGGKEKKAGVIKQICFHRKPSDQRYVLLYNKDHRESTNEGEKLHPQNKTKRLENRKQINK